MKAELNTKYFHTPAAREIPVPATLVPLHDPFYGLAPLSLRKDL